jgi:ankyrin repeat protein
MGTAHNWQAKISDFSHAILLNEKESGQIPPSEANIRGGTRLYDAPEINVNRSIRDWQSLKYVDIWSFGLLSLEILSGTNLGDLIEMSSDDQQSSFECRYDIMLKHCREQLHKAHPRDHTLVQIAMDFGKSCLNVDPPSRPTARNLLTYLQSKLAFSRRFDSSPTSYSPKTLTKVEDLPPFDLSKYYYDLQTTLTVPRRVFMDLNSQVTSEQDLSIHRYALFQLGICYASAFGVEKDKGKAIAHVAHAARSGLLEAQALLPRLYAAMDIPIEDGSLSEIISWLNNAWHHGSVTALQDLQIMSDFDHTSFKDQVSVTLQPRHGISSQVLELLPLHSAVLAGNIDDVKRYASFPLDVNEQGHCGEVALHYLICLRELAGRSMAQELLNQGASISQATSAPIIFSEHAFILNQIDAGMSPLGLAISHDRVDLVTLFMESRRDDVSDEVLVLSARYSSIRCLKYLCTDKKWSEYCRKLVNRFDFYSFSAMYYACRPDVLDRLYHFLPRTEVFLNVSHGQSAITAKEIRIVDLLLNVGASLQIHKEKSFNIFHLLASFGDTALLEQLLRVQEASLLKNQRSDFGWTPLKDAIARGRYEAFEMLLSYKATLKNIWDFGVNDVHALHVCSLSPGADAVRFAEKIIEIAPSSVRARDSTGSTPLHKAARYGRVRLIRLLDKHRASLYAVDKFGTTPLGIAIIFREISAIQELRYRFRERSLPEVSWYGKSLFYNHPVHPVEQLVTPGWHPTTSTLSLEYRTNFGACDHTFSGASLILLEDLLEEFPPRIKFHVNFRQHVLHHPLIYATGVHTAVRMGNVGAVKLILCRMKEASKISASQFRFLLFVALAQLSMNEVHIASLSDRKQMVSELWIMCEENFNNTRTKRLSLRGVSEKCWKIYYWLYGDIEHRQLSVAKQWIERNPRQLIRNNGLWPFPVPADEFHQWHSTRVSLTSLNMLLLVLIEIPTIVFLVIIAGDPSSDWSTTKTAWAIVAFILVSRAKSSTRSKR